MPNSYTYYAVVIRRDAREYSWFLDFPQEGYFTTELSDLRRILRKLIIEHLKRYTTVPPATGLVPLIYKVKKLLAEQGIPQDNFLRYISVTVNLNEDPEQLEAGGQFQYLWTPESSNRGQ